MTLPVFALIMGLVTAFAKPVIAAEPPTASAMTSYIQNAPTPETLLGCDCAATLPQDVASLREGGQAASPTGRLSSRCGGKLACRLPLAYGARTKTVQRLQRSRVNCRASGALAQMSIGYRKPKTSARINGRFIPAQQTSSRCRVRILRRGCLVSSCAAQPLW
jgi:hypothetical protein